MLGGQNATQELLVKVEPGAHVHCPFIIMLLIGHPTHILLNEVDPGGQAVQILLEVVMNPGLQLQFLLVEL